MTGQVCPHGVNVSYVSMRLEGGLSDVNWRMAELERVTGSCLGRASCTETCANGWRVGRRLLMASSLEYLEWDSTSIICWSKSSIYFCRSFSGGLPLSVISTYLVPRDYTQTRPSGGTE